MDDKFNETYNLAKTVYLLSEMQTQQSGMILGLMQLPPERLAKLIETGKMICELEGLIDGKDIFTGQDRAGTGRGDLGEGRLNTEGTGSGHTD